MQTLLIAGTNAQVGKTVVLSALIAYWQRYSTEQVGVMKPIDCCRLVAHQPLGASPEILPEALSEPDCERFRRLFNLAQTPSEITPVMLSSPPPVAAESGGLELEQLWRAFQQLQQQYDLVLLEALGGLGTPLTAQTTVADLAWDWRMPTVLVVPVQPSMVADAVANVALANQLRLHLKGIILNEVWPSSRQTGSADRDPNWPDPEAATELIQSLTHKPVLGYVPHIDPNSQPQLVRAAAGLELERLLPSLVSSTLKA